MLLEISLEPKDWQKLVAWSGFISVPNVAITYGGYTQNYSANSSITPVDSFVFSISVRCLFVDNKVGIPVDILDSFTIEGVSFGANINYAPAIIVPFLNGLN